MPGPQLFGDLLTSTAGRLPGTPEAHADLGHGLSCLAWNTKYSVNRLAAIQTVRVSPQRTNGCTDRTRNTNTPKSVIYTRSAIPEQGQACYDFRKLFFFLSAVTC